MGMLGVEVEGFWWRRDGMGELGLGLGFEVGGRW